MENLRAKFTLELNALSKNYGKTQVLKDINIKIPRGVIYGFIGENGAGKTTTMNIVCGLKKPSSGKVIFRGSELSYDKEREAIGYLPQQPKFYSYMKVQEYLNFILSLSEAKDKAFSLEELLSIVGLKDASKKTIKTLSGGMLQRLGIAVAICNNPELVILDEPSSALDPEGRREVMNIIKGLKDRGMTVFFSTHLLSDAENICDYITIIHKGEILASTTLSSLKDKYGACYYEVKFGDKIDPKSYPSFIKDINIKDDITQIYTDSTLTDERDLFNYLLSLNSPIKAFTKKEVSLEDIFFKIIEGGVIIDL
ncbi:ABC transporter ATP-binding protein [Clostridium folliculivorans]|uniref:ABC transporter ATP-binding protein n=1 Tax=Clostridium folliculivorans TaxID=2886038 RepID=A0A9W5Y049_9CLOT|nr:ABC transporter ATP-binding protein [Clostridium folliculivorans]GKU24246.1 ABC transporter ATP-binding protein [Clostridium folliculivorans]